MKKISMNEAHQWFKLQHGLMASIDKKFGFGKSRTSWVLRTGSPWARVRNAIESTMGCEIEWVTTSERIDVNKKACAKNYAKNREKRLEWQKNYEMRWKIKHA